MTDETNETNELLAFALTKALLGFKGEQGSNLSIPEDALDKQASSGRARIDWRMYTNVVKARVGAEENGWTLKRMIGKPVEYLVEAERADTKGRAFPVTLVKQTSAADLLMQPRRFRPLMLGPWLKRGDGAMLYAPAGVGKSFVALAVAMAVAGGGSIKGLGWETKQTERVLYVDGEMPMEDLQERVLSIMHGGWIDGLDVALMGKNLQFVARQDQPVTISGASSKFVEIDAVDPMEDRFIDLTQGGDRQLLTGFVQRERIGLLVCDNLSTLTAGMEDENSSVEFRAINTFVSRIKALRTAVLVVHHMNKDGISYRGSSAISVIYDQIIQMNRLDEKTEDKVIEAMGMADDESVPSVFSMVFEKNRGKRTKQSSKRRVMALTSFGFREAVSEEQATKIDEDRKAEKQREREEERKAKMRDDLYVALIAAVKNIPDDELGKTGLNGLIALASPDQKRNKNAVQARLKLAIDDNQLTVGRVAALGFNATKEI